MSTTRVRFAPSPTGEMHIGNARTALYNWMFARHEGGAFILRIEDTDRARHDEAAVQVVVDSLQWLGMDWDEGPFFQSERLALYNEKVEALLAEDKAYVDEDPERGACVRLRVPPGISHFDDIVLGSTRVDRAEINDFVIRKADGFPAYNFACVVDDVDMKISHVIRGVGHTKNTHTQLVVYEALGAPIPRFAHMPLILGTDGKPYSKRHGSVSVLDFSKEGYLRQGLANFIALLGWAPGNDEEILPMEEMIRRFDLSDIKKSDAQLNPEKLDWMNGKYIRSLSVPELIEELTPFLSEAGYAVDRYPQAWLEQVVALYQENLKRLAEFPDKAVYFLTEGVVYEEKAVKKVLQKEGTKALLEKIVAALENTSEFTHATLEALLGKIAETESIGFGKIAQPIRVAITGGTVSPGIYDTMLVLGREVVLERLKKAIAMTTEINGTS